MLEAALTKWGYEVVLTRDGAEAWEMLQREDAPQLAILDWMMPYLDGLEVCRRARAASQPKPTYIILLTARGGREDIVAGLQAGADDYITKPFDREELQARVQVGMRIVTLQMSLAERVRELELALANVKQLQGLLPICSYCKKIRDDQNYWQQVEGYLSEHSSVEFSHSICPDCYEHIVKPELETLKAQKEKQTKAI
jgi:CheY-like chemotaxis protein